MGVAEPPPDSGVAAAKAVPLATASSLPPAAAGSQPIAGAVVSVTSQAYSPHQQWVVLRSLDTNTFLSVEPPPSEDAMKVRRSMHALTHACAHLTCPPAPHPPTPTVCPL